MSCSSVPANVKTLRPLPLVREHVLFSTSASADVNVELKCKYLLMEKSRAFLDRVIKMEK